MTEPGAIATTRRYYVIRRFGSRDAGNKAVEATWIALQQQEPGTALPDGFPGRTKLLAAGYLAVEDLQGAEADELQLRAGLTRSTAIAAIAAAG